MRTNPNTTSGGFPGTSERRAHPRHRPQPFAYLKVGEHNGGIVMDASEGGLQMAAANSLAPEKIVRLSLQLSASAEPVEVEARVVWLSESKKTGGFEFVSLTDEARDQIREWLSGEAGKDQFLGPMAVPTRVRDQRIAEVRAEARANGANSEIRTPPVSDSSRRGFETMFPPEGESIPPSPVREVEPRRGEPLNDRVPAAGTGRDPAPFRANPISERPPNRDQFHEREPLRPTLSEARFPARAIFSDSPFQAPASESRWSNARMGLLTGVVMVVCFAGGMIAGRVWMGSWPSGWNLQKLIGGASAPTSAAPPPPAATAPAANPTANPATDADATPDANGSSATAPPASPPAVTTPAAPEGARASSDAGAVPTQGTPPIPSSKEGSAATNSDTETLPPEIAGNSILVTAPAAGSPSVRVTLPQEPLTASASVAIGVRRSAMLPPRPGPVSAHSPERLEFGKIMAPVPSASLGPSGPRIGDHMVVLRVTIGGQGEIKSIVPIRGRDELLPTAERLVRDWQQFPARLNGEPIESTEEVIMTFRTGP